MDDFGGSMTEIECVDELRETFLNFDLVEKVGFLLRLLHEVLESGLNGLCREGEGSTS